MRKGSIATEELGDALIELAVLGIILVLLIVPIVVKSTTNTVYKESTYATDASLVAEALAGSKGVITLSYLIDEGRYTVRSEDTSITFSDLRHNTTGKTRHFGLSEGIESNPGFVIPKSLVFSKDLGRIGIQPRSTGDLCERVSAPNWDEGKVIAKGNTPDTIALAAQVLNNFFTLVEPVEDLDGGDGTTELAIIKEERSNIVIERGADSLTEALACNVAVELVKELGEDVNYLHSEDRPSKNGITVRMNSSAIGAVREALREGYEEILSGNS